MQFFSMLITVTRLTARVLLYSRDNQLPLPKYPRFCRVSASFPPSFCPSGPLGSFLAFVSLARFWWDWHVLF